MWDSVWEFGNRLEIFFLAHTKGAQPAGALGYPEINTPLVN